jgi:4-hydroxybenzoate polyprenyltransferase
LKFGDRTKPFLAACYAATTILLALAGWLAGLSWAFLPTLLVPAAMLGWQVRTLDIHDPARCLMLFQSNREVGFAIALAFLAGRL